MWGTGFSEILPAGCHSGAQAYASPWQDKTNQCLGRREAMLEFPLMHSIDVFLAKEKG
jgi:hypothetical protein